jgi:hypothetical protein
MFLIPGVWPINGLRKEIAMRSAMSLKPPAES